MNSALVKNSREPCLVVAEAGSNHGGNLDTALELIHVAADCGADIVKFQLFRTDKLYAKNAGSSDYLGSERSINDIVRAAELPAKWLPRLAQECRDKDIGLMVTPFDELSADRVDPYVALHKCASYELTHHPLLAHIARKGKPMLVSTGTADLEEVRSAAQVIETAGNRQIVFLQCTASYPTPLDQVNLRAMDALATLGYAVGLSDHSRHPTIAPTAAVARGARVVEKHFTLSNDLPGPDHRFALEPNELAELVRAVRETESVLGHGEKKPLDVEMELRRFARRSIFTRKPIGAGEAFDLDNLAVLRCGKLAPGLSPASLSHILGRRARRFLEPDVSVGKDDVE